VYGAGLPGADAKPAWQTLAVLTDREEIPDDRALRSGIWKWLTGSREGLAGLVPLEGIPEEGVRFSGGADPERRFLPDYGQDGEPEGGFRLLRVERTFGTEELSMGSPPLQALEGEPFLGVSAADAKDLGLEDGDGVEVAGRGGPVRLTVSVSARIAPGVLVMPRHRRVDWQAFGSGEVRVRAGDIQKTAPAAGGPGGGGTDARRDD
jgi:NADH-quinone oxidoreductase subunit G